MAHQKAKADMGRYRAIMTETDREYISGKEQVEENKRHQSISRVRKRISKELPRDIEVLREHHPGLLEELRDVVCEVPLTRAFEITAGVLEVLDRTRAGHEVLVKDVLDEIAEEYPPEYDEDGIRAVMHAMAEAGLLVEREGVMHTSYQKPGVEPSECEWCSAPLPEAGRYDVTVYDEDGQKVETVTICSECLSEKY